MSIGFTPEEVNLLTDETFFLSKARIMGKVRASLGAIYTELQEELAGVSLLAPPGFDGKKCQFVKGEHLEDYPYQYLDFPKHFNGDDKFTFRSLFWWGHHFAFALILEGEGVTRYRHNLLNRYGKMADRHLSLCLGPSLWEWKQGNGYTLPMTRDRRPEVAAVLSDRRFFKLVRFVRLDDPVVREGRLAAIGRETVRSILPVITA